MVNLPYRYIEENFRRSGRYRNYNKLIPHWLHDKLQKFTRHCAERITSAKCVKSAEIIVNNLDRLTFHVRSQSTNDIHNVSLGDKTNLPNCSCDDWRRSLMPCKHMFTILDHVDGVTWTSISEKYRESPFFKLNYSVFRWRRMQRGGRS